MSDFSRDPKLRDVEVKNFKPRSLNGEVIHDYQDVKKRFGSLASTDPTSNSHFSLHPESKRNLGIEAEEKSHLEEQVSREVEIRVKQIREKAYQEGFIRGQEDGKISAEKEFFDNVQPQFDRLMVMLAEFDNVKTEMYLANEQFLIQLIFQIAKTVTLNELKYDRGFVKRITGQIIEKVGAKENIRLRVSQEDYKNIDDLREFLKTQFPELKNIQIDPSDEMVLGGIKIETDLSRINATVESQLEAIHAALVLGDT